MLDWVAHLEHLQSILLEYNLVRALTKPIMFKYFQKDLKPSVLAELEYRDLKLENFDQIVKKTIDIEVKSTLQPHSNTKKIDQKCPWDNQLANFTIAKSSGNTIKDTRSEKTKAQGIELSSSPQCSESFKKT